MTNNDNQTAVPFSLQASAPDLEEQALEEITGAGGIGDAIRKMACCTAPRTTSPVRERPPVDPVSIEGAATPQHHAQIFDHINEMALRHPDLRATQAAIGASGDITYRWQQRT
jgi:hypothetical protein